MDEVTKKNFILINHLSGGGAERQVSYISKLKSIDKLILLEPLITYEIPVEKTIIVSDSKNGTLIVNKIINLFNAIKILKKIGLNRNTNLICFLQLSYIIGFVCKILFKCKLTYCIRTNPFGFYEQYKGMKIPFFIYQYMLRSADHIVCNSKTTADELNHKFNFTKAQHIPNGYDINSLNQQAEQSLNIVEAVFHSNKVLITAGRLLHDKGQWHLIRIFAQLLKQNNHIKLAILGEGPLLSQLINLCHSFNLNVFDSSQNHDANENYDVYFLGFQKNPYSFIKKSYLFLMPSLYEGLPNAPIESLLVSTPCILSDCKSGPREILKPDSNLNNTANSIEESSYGYLLPPFNGEEIFNTSELIQEEKFWVNVIDSLLKDEIKYLKMKENTCSINEVYDLNKVNIQWLKFLNS